MEEHSGTGGNREIYHGVETLPTTFQNGRSPSPGDGEGGERSKNFQWQFLSLFEPPPRPTKAPNRGFKTYALARETSGNNSVSLQPY